MKYRSILMCAALLAWSAMGLAEQQDVQGVLGLTNVGARSCVAVWVPVPADSAVTGVMWYNNDNTVVFPAWLATAGDGSGPGNMVDAVSLAEAVQGGSCQWSEQPFSEPVASTADGLYLVLQLPQGSSPEEQGTGGGAGIGYRLLDEEGPVTGWISYDGVNWVPLAGDVALAVRPVLTAAGPQTLRLAPVTEKRGGKGEETPDMPLRTELRPLSPNPFNPQTRVRFTLKTPGEVDLSVFDAMGRRVKRLARGRWSAGEHVLTWHGEDDRGHPLASGVYLVQLKADGRQQVQRALLVR